MTQTGKSSIIYLNDNYNSPTLLTNVDIETYKFKEFTEKQKIAFYFPQKNKTISFEGGKYYHGKCDFTPLRIEDAHGTVTFH